MKLGIVDATSSTGNHKSISCPLVISSRLTADRASMTAPVG
jgi:hypothetical protein